MAYLKWPRQSTLLTYFKRRENYLNNRKSRNYADQQSVSKKFDVDKERYFSVLKQGGFWMS